MFTKKEKIYPAYVSKDNFNQEKQVIFLMIPNGEGRHSIAVKQLPALLRVIMSKCPKCLLSFRKLNKRDSHKKVFDWK